ncbi:MAG TPA: hypothetical protein VHA33_26810 [Candidatus Angelobacter sp.]|nr:hypothetical protein [Candidatus Angelobacter sp.]
MKPAVLNSNNSRLPLFVGLGVALGGTALLVSPASRIVGDPAKLTTRVLYQLILWVLLGLVILIVTLWERRSLSSIGLTRWR